MAQMKTASAIERAIESAVRSEVARVADEEIAEAQKRIRERIGEMMDSLALRVLSEYQIWSDETRVVIEVKKPEGQR